MKTRILLALGIIGILLTAVACSSVEGAVPKKPSIVDIGVEQLTNEKHITQEIELNSGETLTIILGSNPSTGFSWNEQAQIGDSDILEQLDHTVTPREGIGGAAPLPGAAGKETWNLRALKAGTTTITLSYSRPWEGGEQGEWTLQLTAVVK